MNHKKIIFLIFLQSTIVAMDIQNSIKKNSLIEFFGIDNKIMNFKQKDIQSILASLIINNNQFWYLDTITEYPNEALFASPNKNLLQPFEYPCDMDISRCPANISNHIFSIPFTYSGNNLMNHNDPDLWNDRLQCYNPTQKLLAYNVKNYNNNSNDIHISYPRKGIKIIHTNDIIHTITFDPSGERIAIGMNNITTIGFFDIATQNIIYQPLDGKILAVNFDTTGKKLAVGCTDRKVLIIFTDEQNKTISLVHNYPCITSLCFNASGTQLAIGTSGGIAHIVDIATQQEIARFRHKDGVSSLCFDLINNSLVTTSADYKIRKFSQHSAWTLPQLLLKKIFSLWLLLEKPNKNIHTINLLLTHIAHTLNITKRALDATWTTFSETMQAALWRNMRNKILKYGKEDASSKQQLICAVKSEQALIVTQKQPTDNCVIS